MVIYKNGDLLESGCNIICHQVNIDGVMGGGLALQIAKKYSEAEKKYKIFLNTYERLCKRTEYAIGTVCFASCKQPKTDKKILIANCFSQNRDFSTNYEAVEKCFNYIKEMINWFNERFNKQDITIGIPYGYGCGIAKGEWKKVDKIIHDVFENSELRCEIWKL